MDVTKIPFNEFIGLAVSAKPGFLMELSGKPEYSNHLGTVHASAMFALAEATSGFLLADEFKFLDGIVPVVRKVETRYRKPASGNIYSNAELLKPKEETLTELTDKGRTILNVAVSLFDSNDNKVMESVFEWFVTKR